VRGFKRLRPRCYLSTEWGVATGSVAIGIPFYLARPDLTALQLERVGHVEGFNAADILRYLRHEMGHVVNYGYRLYEQEEWVEYFGSITQPYVEEYRPEPFSRRYVRHLPGWYAQKHPDEDWSETFAVLVDTRAATGARSSTRLACGTGQAGVLRQDLHALADRDPDVTDDELDEDVSQLWYSVDDFYSDSSPDEERFLGAWTGALRTIFEDLSAPQDAPPEVPRIPASSLIRRYESDLMANVYRWTGHFPEATRPLLRHLAARADVLKQVYPEGAEATALMALTTLVTALAANHVFRGTYWP
jgi:hypothetical protein